MIEHENCAFHCKEKLPFFAKKQKTMVLLMLMLLLILLSTLDKQADRCEGLMLFGESHCCRSHFVVGRIALRSKLEKKQNENCAFSQKTDVVVVVFAVDIAANNLLLLFSLLISLPTTMEALLTLLMLFCLLLCRRHLPTALRLGFYKEQGRQDQSEATCRCRRSNTRETRIMRLSIAEQWSFSPVFCVPFSNVVLF
jgi:hypothetical protein